MTTDSEAWVRAATAVLPHATDHNPAGDAARVAAECADALLALYRERQKRGDFGVPLDADAEERARYAISRAARAEEERDNALVRLAAMERDRDAERDAWAKATRERDEQRARAEAAELRVEVDENALRITKEAMTRDRALLKEALAALAMFRRLHQHQGGDLPGVVLLPKEDYRRMHDLLSKARAQGYIPDGEAT